MNAIFQTPPPVNEPILNYAPDSAERAQLKALLAQMKSEQIDVPMFIGGKEIRTGNKVTMHPPHETAHILGHYHKGDGSHVRLAIDAALKAKPEWEAMSWEDRAAIFLRAGELLAGPFRAKLNAATMHCQSKNAFQAEIDAACELIDFFRFNVHFMTEIYSHQPISPRGIWNRMEYRALEGFVLAVTPFNFTSIAGNLPTAPALMGNTVVWKCANSQIYSAWFIMQLLREAGLPDGVINLIYTGGAETGEIVFAHPEFAGIHFTGSTGTFNYMWKTIGRNISNYKSYPRLVGETGGKDFVVAHRSANAKQVATALSRGAFEYQGQKCSAASRAYIPSNLWNEVKNYLQEDLASMKMGSPENFSNFVNAVIDRASFDSLKTAIDQAKKDGIEFVAGGKCDDSIGYFIEPTVLLAKDALYSTMCNELFGPVLSVHVYDENKFSETLRIADRTSPYGLTGAIFALDRRAIIETQNILRHSAGNFYINDKPTGAVVGQQPFGGARGSGTNDKAGSWLNLIRWCSPRTIKETFVSPSDYRYDFLKAD